MHGPINVKSPNNISIWQMGFNSAFKGLTTGKSHGKKPDRFSLHDDTDVKTGTGQRVAQLHDRYMMMNNQLRSEELKTNE
jgi:hypothetical protein